MCYPWCCRRRRPPIKASSSPTTWVTRRISAAARRWAPGATPPPSLAFQTTVSMTFNGDTFDVDVFAELNVGTGLLTVIFQSIDPATKLPPANPLTGFLPPEDGTGRGQGYVTYTVQAKAGSPT